MRRSSPLFLALGVVLVAVVAAGCTDSSKAALPSVTTVEPSTTLGGGRGFEPRAPGVLTVAAPPGPAPLSATGAGGSLPWGLEHDVARVLAAELGLGGVRIVAGSLDGVLVHRDCGCDLFLGQVVASDELARIMDLTEPYLSADAAVLVRAGYAPSTPAELRTLRWARLLDDLRAVQVIEELAPLPPVAVVVDLDSALRSLREGRVDAVVVDAPSALAVQATDPNVAVLGRIPTGDSYVAALPIGSANTAELNNAIVRLRESGVFDFLARRYLGLEPQGLPELPPP